MADRYFLVIRNNVDGTTDVRSFSMTQRDAAFRAYFDAERRHDVYTDDSESADLEIVLIVADSEAGLREAYPHYFSEGTRLERQDRLIENLDQLLLV